jgi:hypothetical protein
MSHTYNGKPIQGCDWCEAGYVPVVSSVDPHGKIFVHLDFQGRRIICAATSDKRRRTEAPNTLRAALREALQLIDELMAGDRGAWTVEDVKRIAAWRELARE